jgi:phosphonate transport system permease protein
VGGLYQQFPLNSAGIRHTEIAKKATRFMQDDKPISGFRKPFYAHTRFMVAALIALAVYSYGWKVTEIQPGELWRDIHLVKPLVKELFKPDLFTPNSDSLSIEADFLLTDQAPAAKEAPRLTKDKPMMKLSRSYGKAGDPLTIDAQGLPKNLSGDLYWVNSVEVEIPLQKIQTDEQGQLRLDIVVPEMARGERQKLRAIFTWETGGYHMSHTLKLTLDKMVETLFLALMATSIAIVFAMPLSFLGARNLMYKHATGKMIYFIVRTGFNILRSIEPLIMAILFAVWVGIGPFAGMLALTVHSIAALGKLFSEQIESIDPGPVEAITATGASSFQVILYGVVPQVLPQFLALSFYRWDINVRMSTVIGFVGGGGIRFHLQQWINLLQYNQAGTALLAIAAVIITLDVISARIRDRIIRQ